MDEVPMYLAQSYSDVIIDALILALPVPWIWRLKMRSRTKVAITAVFFLGALWVFQRDFEYFDTECIQDNNCQLRKNGRPVLHRKL